MNNNYSTYKPTSITVFIVFIYLIIVWINKNIIFDIDFYYRVWQSKYSLERIDNLIIQNNKLSIFSYFIWPCILYIKWFLITIVIFIGTMLFENKISFKNCFKIILYAEIIPILSSITKTLYFYIYPPNNLEILQNLNPLGLIRLLNHDTIPKYLLYPIQQLNLFEVGYWLLLAYGINSLGNVDFKKALKITSLSYGVGLLIWCIFIVFLQLQFS
jgi:hypothetical protein